MKYTHLIWLPLVLVLLLISCGKESSDSTLNEQITIEKIKYHELSPGCDSLRNDNCAEIKIIFPRISYPENTIVEKKINESILSFFTQSVTGESEEADFESIMDEFIQDYESFKQEFPGAPQSWIVERIGELKLNKANILSFDFTEYAFTGGAHPNTFVSFKNFNLTDGEEILLEDIIKTEKNEELRKVAEKEFRSLKGLSVDADLGESGFWFEENEFGLNDNFLITETGLLFYYNNYEITAYAFGPTELMIPYSMIKDFINDTSPVKNLIKK